MLYSFPTNAPQMRQNSKVMASSVTTIMLHQTLVCYKIPKKFAMKL